jgi:hypothetical protein
MNHGKHLLFAELPYRIIEYLFTWVLEGTRIPQLNFTNSGGGDASRHMSASYIADSITVRHDKSIQLDNSKYKDRTDYSLDASITRERYSDRSTSSSSSNFRERIVRMSAALKNGAFNFLSTRPMALVSKKLILKRDLVLDGPHDGRHCNITFTNHSLIQKFGKTGRLEIDLFHDEDNFKFEIAILG